MTGQRACIDRRSWLQPLALALSTGTAAAQVDRKVLRVVPSADPAELDPTQGLNLISRIFAQMVFDTLFALDSHLAPKPMMVDREQVSPDGLTYTFTLRPGLKFHDGSPVTSRDVVASLERWMNGISIGGQLKSRTASLGIVDERTFTLVLNQRFGLVEFMLAGPGAPIAGIMREADAKRDVTVPMTNPIGSGPFRYVASERESGHRVVFEKFADYIPRSEPPDGLAGARVVKVDRVEWTIMPDATTAANALAKGEVDFWEQVNPDLTGMLKKQGITVRRIAALPTVAFIRPNFQLPPFNDVRARQALALPVRSERDDGGGRRRRRVVGRNATHSASAAARTGRRSAPSHTAPRTSPRRRNCSRRPATRASASCCSARRNSRRSTR